MTAFAVPEFVIGFFLGVLVGVLVMALIQVLPDELDESSFVPPDYPKDVVDLEWERLERERHA